MVLGVWGWIAPAQAQNYEGKTIREVRIAGLERVSEQLIRSQLEVQAGQAYNAVAISRDIRRLYDTTYFTSIEADVQPSGDQVILTYRVEEKRVISEIKIIGNDKLRTRAVRSVINWREGDTFVEEAYDDERQAILDLYQSKGMPNTTVDIVVEEVGPSRVRITYMIDEGRKARIRSVDFVGNEALSDRQLKRGLATKRRWWIVGGKYDETAFEADLDKVVNKYGDVGRLEAEVTGTEISYSESGKRMDIQVQVQEGPEYRVGTLEVAGNEVYDDDEIIDLLKVQPGEVHNKTQVEKDAALVQKGYADSGYIRAGVTPQVTLDRENTTTNVVQRVEEGQLQYVKEIKITGNTVSRDDVIRRNIFLNPGERFDGALLEASQRRLEDLGYYDAIRMSMEETDDERFSNLLVDVEEGDVGFWNFGAGYSTDEGVGAYTELRFNNFDITNWPTFQGGGQQFRLRLHIGDRRNEYNLSFTDPEFLGYPLLFGFDLFDESYEYQGGTDYTEEMTGVQIRFGKVLSPYVTARSGLKYRSVNYSDLDIGPFSPLRPYIGEDVTVSTVWGINRTTTDSTRDPSKGARHDLQLELAGLGGDNDFWKFEHDSQWYWPLDSEKKWILSYRTREGIGSAWGSSENIPLSDRFYAGGTTTVRGYDSRDIGPQVRTNLFFGDEERIGGEMRLVQNLEVKWKVNKFFRLYGFVDAGGVWLEPSDFDFGDVRASTGIGIGFDVPRMGPIRLDYGIPLNADEDQGSGKLHLQGGFRF